MKHEGFTPGPEDTERMRQNAVRMAQGWHTQAVYYKERCQRLEKLLRQSELNFGHLIQPLSLMDEIRAALNEEAPK